MKTCSICKIRKQKRDFHFCERAKSGCQSGCKVCLNSLQRANHKANPEKRCRYQRRKYRENPDAHIKRNAAYYAAHPDKCRNRTLKHLYGITLLAFEAMVKAQKGRCAICLEKQNTLCVDHNHKSGEVRGLLCRACNIAIGALDDSPGVCEAAAMYLRKFSTTIVEK